MSSFLVPKINGINELVEWFRIVLTTKKVVNMEATLVVLSGAPVITERPATAFSLVLNPASVWGLQRPFNARKSAGLAKLLLIACRSKPLRKCSTKSASAISAINTTQLRFVLPLDEFHKELDELVPLSSIARLQQTDQSTAVDFYSVSGFQTRNTLKCKLFSS